MHKSTVCTHSFHSMGKPEILGFSHHSLLEQLWGHLWSIPCPPLTPREVHHLQKRLETSEEQSPPPPWAAHPSALSPWDEGVLPTATPNPVAQFASCPGTGGKRLVMLGVRVRVRARGLRVRVNVRVRAGGLRAAAGCSFVPPTQQQ